MGTQSLRADGAEARLGAARLDRCQSSAFSPGLNPEDAYELGNKNVVERVYDAPSVSVTIQNNEHGTTRALALALGKSFGCKVAASGSGININEGVYSSYGGNWVLENKLTGLAISATSSDTRIDVVSLKKQSTAPQYTITGGVEAGSPSAPSTPANEIKIAEVLVGTGGITSVTDSRSSDFTVYNENSLASAKTEYSTLLKDPSTDALFAAELINELYLTRMTGRFSITGFAEETLEFVSDRHTLIKGTAMHLVRETHIAGGTTSLTLDATPVQLTNNSKYILALYVGDTNGGKTLYKEVAVASESTDFSISGTTVTFATAPAAGVIITVLFGAVLDPAPTFQRLNTTYKGGIKKPRIVPYLSDGSTDTILLRGQELSYDIPVDREEDMELGNKYAYDRSIKYPVKGTGTVSFKHTDLNIFWQIVGKTAANENAISLSDYERDAAATTVNLGVKIYADEAQTTLLKTVQLTEIAVESLTPAGGKSVGGVLTSDFNFQFDSFTITNNYY